MIAGKRPDNPVVLIQHGIGAKTALDDRFANVIQIIGQMKILQFIGTGDAADRNRLEDEPGGPVGVKGAGNQAGGGRLTAILLAQGGAAEDEAGGAGFKGKIRHILLISAQDNGTGTDPAGLAGKGNRHLAGDFLKAVLLRIENMPFQGAEQIKDGNGGDDRIQDGPHVVFRHAACGDQAEKPAVLLNDGKAGNTVVIIMQHIPGMGDRYTGADGGRRVIIDIQYLGANGAQINRRLKAKPVQEKRGLRIQMAAAGRDVAGSAEGVLQGGIGHG